MQDDSAFRRLVLGISTSTTQPNSSIAVSTLPPTATDAHNPLGLASRGPVEFLQSIVNAPVHQPQPPFVTRAVPPVHNVPLTIGNAMHQLHPSATAGMQPHTTGMQPLHTTGMQPLHTTGMQPLYTTGMQPLHTTGMQPLHTTGMQPLHTTGMQPLHATGMQPLHATGMQPLHATGVQPLHATGVQPLHTTGMQPLHMQPLLTAALNPNIGVNRLPAVIATRGVFTNPMEGAVSRAPHDGVSTTHGNSIDVSGAAVPGSAASMLAAHNHNRVQMLEDRTKELWAAIEQTAADRAGPPLFPQGPSASSSLQYQFLQQPSYALSTKIVDDNNFNTAAGNDSTGGIPMLTGGIPMLTGRIPMLTGGMAGGHGRNDVLFSPYMQFDADRSAAPAFLQSALNRQRDDLLPRNHQQNHHHANNISPNRQYRQQLQYNNSRQQQQLLQAAVHQQEHRQHSLIQQQQEQLNNILMMGSGATGGITGTGGGGVTSSTTAQLQNAYMYQHGAKHSAGTATAASDRHQQMLTALWAAGGGSASVAASTGTLPSPGVQHLTAATNGSSTDLQAAGGTSGVVVQDATGTGTSPGVLSGGVMSIAGEKNTDTTTTATTAATATTATAATGATTATGATGATTATGATGATTATGATGATTATGATGATTGATATGATAGSRNGTAARGGERVPPSRQRVLGAKNIKNSKQQHRAGVQTFEQIATHDMMTPTTDGNVSILNSLFMPNYSDQYNNAVHGSIEEKFVLDLVQGKIPTAMPRSPPTGTGTGLYSPLHMYGMQGRNNRSFTVGDLPSMRMQNAAGSRGYSSAALPTHFMRHRNTAQSPVGSYYEQAPPRDDRRVQSSSNRQQQSGKEVKSVAGTDLLKNVLGDLYKPVENERRTDPFYRHLASGLYHLNIVMPIVLPYGDIVVDTPSGQNYYEFGKGCTGAQLLFGRRETTRVDSGNTLGGRTTAAEKKAAAVKPVDGSDEEVQFTGGVTSAMSTTANDTTTKTAPDANSMEVSSGENISSTANAAAVRITENKNTDVEKKNALPDANSILSTWDDNSGSGPVCDTWASFLHVRLGTVYNVPEELVPVVCDMFNDSFDAENCTFFVPIRLDCKGVYMCADNTLCPRAADGDVDESIQRYETRCKLVTENDGARFRMIRRYLKKFARDVMLLHSTHNTVFGGMSHRPLPDVRNLPPLPAMRVELHPNCKSLSLSGGIRVLLREFSPLSKEIETIISAVNKETVRTAKTGSGAETPGNGNDPLSETSPQEGTTSENASKTEIATTTVVGHTDTAKDASNVVETKAPLQDRKNANVAGSGSASPSFDFSNDSVQLSPPFRLDLSARVQLGEIRLEFTRFRMFDPRFPSQLVIGRRIADGCPDLKVPMSFDTRARFVFCDRIENSKVRYAFKVDRRVEPVFWGRTRAILLAHLEENPKATETYNLLMAGENDVVESKQQNTVSPDVSRGEEDTDSSFPVSPTKSIEFEEFDHANEHKTFQSNEPCRYFLSGMCARGDSCFYLHSADPRSDSIVDVREVLKSQDPKFF